MVGSGRLDLRLFTAVRRPSDPPHITAAVATIEAWRVSAGDVLKMAHVIGDASRAGARCNHHDTGNPTARATGRLFCLGRSGLLLRFRIGHQPVNDSRQLVRLALKARNRPWHVAHLEKAQHLNVLIEVASGPPPGAFRSSPRDPDMIRPDTQPSPRLSKEEPTPLWRLTLSRHCVPQPVPATRPD
jgi:hypothetical protein